MKDPIVPKNARETTAAFAEPHSYVESEHGRLAYWRFGRGPNVVLVHGWPLHSATFRAIVPELARRFTLHLVDLPGTGKTEWTGPIGLASHAATLRRAIDTLGLRRYAMVAHDSGGAVARLVAADDPRVSALVIGNTEIPGHRPWLLQGYVAAARTRGLSGLLLSSLRVGLIRRSFLGFGGCFRDPAFVDGEFGDLFIRPLLRSQRAAAGQLAFVQNFDFDLIDGLAAVHTRIQAPVLLVWGPDDPFFPVEKARRMLGQFNWGAELVEIPGAKLLAHEDHPEAFAAYARLFLARHTKAEAAEAA